MLADPDGEDVEDTIAPDGTRKSATSVLNTMVAVCMVTINKSRGVTLSSPSPLRARRRLEKSWRVE
jgi:hypothetical protein